MSPAAKLTLLDTLPRGILEAAADRLHEYLDGPTLIHLPGRRSPPLFVSVLLHGNENTGWDAARALLKRHGDYPLPRALSLFVGNVQAARFGLRTLDGQPDFNRIWRGEGTPEHRTMREVVEIMRHIKPFASIDVHNNTGRNPHYACVNHLHAANLNLAARFARTAVYFTTPDTVQSRAFSAFCPAVTLECGQPGTTSGLEHVLEFLDACLHLAKFPEHPVHKGDMELFHTVATVKVPDDVSLGFAGEDTDLVFTDDLDSMNFRELPTGTVIARVHPEFDGRLVVIDEEGREVGEKYFLRRGNEIVTCRPFIPSMLTLDMRVIRQDCLCYVMERYQL
ncbi:MAG: peptidase M14 [Gammaproteobacteria bacterium]|nr:MAG: peptidase M14 [Gammaproteobacteria bacterium]